MDKKKYLNSGLSSLNSPKVRSVDDSFEESEKNKYKYVLNQFKK